MIKCKEFFLIFTLISALILILSISVAVVSQELSDASDQSEKIATVNAAQDTKFESKIMVVSVTEQELAGSKNYRQSIGAVVDVSTGPASGFLFSGRTDSSGRIVDVELPKGVPLFFTVRKAGYRLLQAKRTIGALNMESFRLEILEECQPDCTKNDDVCYAECHPFCNYDAKLGIGQMYVCHKVKKGWEVEIDQEHLTYCCKGDIIEKPKLAQYVVDTSALNNIHTFKRLVVLPDGTQADMHISVWD